MKRIYSLVFSGLLASASMVCATEVNELTVGRACSSLSLKLKKEADEVSWVAIDNLDLLLNEIYGQGKLTKAFYTWLEGELDKRTFAEQISFLRGEIVVPDGLVL